MRLCEHIFTINISEINLVYRKLMKFSRFYLETKKLSEPVKDKPYNSSPEGLQLY